MARTFKIFQSIDYTGCKKKIRPHRPPDGNGFPSIQLPCNRFQIFLAFPAHNQSDIRQRVVVDEPIQLGTLLHGVRDRVLDGGCIDRRHKAIFIFDIHTGGVDVKLTGYNSSHSDSSLCFGCSFGVSFSSFTYIPISGNMLYMCAVLDLCGKVVLAWKIGADMTSSLVTDTIREALQTEKVTGGLALHSDQGSQYTSQAYFDLAQAYHVSPSMSSPGCPYDNAAMENFFGTLKTECLYRAHFTTRAEVEQLVTEYVDFYNFERIALKNGLTPVEIRSKTA